MVNVTVEARNDVDTPGLVKLQSDTWELNIWATTDELWKLADIEKTDWDQRRTLQVGTSAKAPVWWSERDGTVDILVGHDDVTWDFGVTVPLSTVHNLLAELGDLRRLLQRPLVPRFSELSWRRRTVCPCLRLSSGRARGWRAGR
jgi:hypothetical protein